MPRRDRVLREWNDLMESLTIGTVVNSRGLLARLNDSWWTTNRVGWYLRCDPRVRSLGRGPGHEGPTNYEVIGG